MPLEYEDDLDGFIVSDVEENNENEPPSPQDEQRPDRLAALTLDRRVNDTQTSKVLRAHISVLASALGGPDHTSENGLYKLGHDALACLKDLKRWIRAVDERNGTYDVALACAECGLVTNDLTVILCQWDKPPPGVLRSRITDKIMLACLELLVLLTWPTEVNKNTLYKDFTAKTNNRRAQLAYKQHILSYKGGLALRAVIRLGINALKVPREDREPRDLSILRLILFFIRNVLFIAPLPASKGPKAITNSAALPFGISPDDIALPAVILAFERNNVFLFLTLIAHLVLKEITDESFGLLTMECLSLLTRGVLTRELVNPTIPVQNATTVVPPASYVKGMNLEDLLGEETRRKNHQKNQISTRHGRFGTLLSIQNTSNASYYAVSGQKALASTYDLLDKLDRSKNWHKTSNFKYDSNNYVKELNVVLGLKASELLLRFVNNLLVSGAYNNVVNFVGRHFTTYANGNGSTGRGILDAIDGNELASYFLIITWLFRFKRQRTEAFELQKRLPESKEDGLDYGSVGAALSEVNFLLLISYFRSSYESKDYDSLHVAMVAFREMLLISNSIFNKKRSQQEIDLENANFVNEDRELAEGIIRKLFSQKQFLDVCVNIPRTALKHSPEYLGVVVSVVHILLKSFETLANEDIHLFVKTRRRMRKLDKLAGLNKEMDKEHMHLIDRGSDEEEDEEQIRYITQERKLNFQNTEVRFFHAETVSTHIDYLAKFEDLTHEEIKRAISFFHRLFVVRKDYSALFRLDFMTVIYKLQAHLLQSSSIKGHVDEFIVYFMKKFKSALARFPTAIELLFPRFENFEIKQFLSTGDLEAKQTKTQESRSRGGPKSSYFDEDAVQPRAAPPLQFIDETLSLDQMTGACVYFLVKKKNTAKFLHFLVSELERLARLEEQGTVALKLELNLSNRRLLISDPYLRLLLETFCFKLPFLQNDETVLRQNFNRSVLLKEAGQALSKWLALHEAGVGDIEPFLDQTRREVFEQEDLDFGAECLAATRAGQGIDDDKADRLRIDEMQLHKLMGMARRKEYDETVAAQYYADDDYPDPVGMLDDDDEVNVSTRRSRARSRARGYDSDVELAGSDEELGAQRSQRKRRSRRDLLLETLDSDDESRTKSALMVNDSDDDSDDERNNAFFEKEERLRRLIAQSGGISNKDNLAAFRESWAALLNANSDSQVMDAVDKAASLFVDLEGEDDLLLAGPTQTSAVSPEAAKLVHDEIAEQRKRAHDEIAEQRKRMHTSDESDESDENDENDENDQSDKSDESDED